MLELKSKDEEGADRLDFLEPVIDVMMLGISIADDGFLREENTVSSLTYSLQFIIFSACLTATLPSRSHFKVVDVSSPLIKGIE